MNKTDEIRRAGLYLRVSTRDQNPELQMPDLERMAHAKRWAVVDRYVDHGVSGDRESRPELDRMMEDVRRGRIDAVVCWSVSRFGRSMVNAVMLIEDLKNAGVVAVFYQQGLDTSTPVGRGVCALLAALAEAELEEMRSRTNLGLDEARKRGQKLGRPFRKGVDLEKVKRLRAEGWTWHRIEKEMGVVHAVLRRQLKAEKEGRLLTECTGRRWKSVREREGQG